MRVWALGLALGLALGCDDDTSATSCADGCSIAASICLEQLCADTGCAGKADCGADCIAVGDLCRQSC